MDPLTHALMGALLAGALAIEQRHGVTATALLILASMAPDLDALSLLFGQEHFLRHYRSLFHSVGAGAVMALVLAAAAYVLTPIKDFAFLLAVFSAGLALHLIVDLLASWQISLFAPFIDHRYSLDLVWFINLTVLLVVAGALIRMRVDRENAQQIAGTSLALIALYMAFRWYQRRRIIQFVRDERLSADPDTLLTAIAPQLAFFTWHALVRAAEGYSLHDIHFCLVPASKRTLTGGAGGTRILSSQKVSSSPDNPVVAASKNANLVKTFLARARFPVATVQERASASTVEWDDVHLMLAGGVIRGVVVEVDTAGQILHQRFKLKPELETQQKGVN